MRRLRRYLVAGLVVWLPIGVTILVVKVLLDLMDRLLLLLPPDYRPDALFGFHVPGLGVLLALLLLLVTGVLVANFLGRRTVALVETLLERIPLVRTVYGAVKNFAEMVLSDSTSTFDKVLLIEYPRPGLYSLAFQTSEHPPELEAKTGQELVCVFLPTTPNPTSGFTLMVPRQTAIELDMPVEQALKMIISLGVVVPDWHPPHPGAAVAENASSSRPNRPETTPN